jgi:NHL repeat/Galactose oxidase, central domain
MRNLGSFCLLSVLAGGLVAAIGSVDATGGFVPLVNILGTAAKLPEMKGVAVDAAGNVFFAAGGFSDYSVLRWDAATGLLTTAAGNGTPGFSGDKGPAASAQLNGVTDIALDSAGNLYIADAYNDRVRKVSNGIITTVAGGGSSFPCDQCAATSVDLGFLTGITSDSAGNLYLFTEGLVFKSSNGVLTKLLGYGTLYPDGAVYASGAAAVDSAGNLYVANFGLNKVQKVSNGVVSTVAGTGVLGFSGDGGPATSAQLSGPRGVAVDAAGNLYIADTGNQRIRKVSNGMITTMVGGGPVSPGLGDNGPAIGALLNYPFGVGVDSAGNIYVQDTVNHRIRKVANGVITTATGGGPTPVLMARSAGTFSTTGNMSVGRSGSTVTLLDNGKVLVAGGYGLSKNLASAELYDPSTGTFSATGDMTSALAATLATLLPDGRVLIVSSTASNDGSAPAATQLYDPATGTFTSGSSALTISRPFTATLLNNSKVLITGGNGPMPGSLTNYAAELYDPLTGVFTSAGKMSGAHSFPSATLLTDGRVLLAESRCGNDPADLRGNELYDPLTGTFSAIQDTLSCITVGPRADLLSNGQVLLGGTVYDPSAGTFTSGPEVVHWGYAATLLTDGTLLIAGGEPLNCYPLFFCEDLSIPDVYLRDPATGTFGFTGFMAFPRDYAQATFLPDGTVLMSGGVDLDVNNPSRVTVELYTPPVLVPAPMLFSMPGDGTGQGAIWHATGKIASLDNPAVAGEILSMYTTSLIEGSAVPPRVIVGGRLAEVVYFGDAPGYPGFFQINFRVPAGIAPGSVPVRLRYLDRPSNEVTIGVK